MSSSASSNAAAKGPLASPTKSLKNGLASSAVGGLFKDIIDRAESAKRLYNRDQYKRDMQDAKLGNKEAARQRYEADQRKALDDKEKSDLLARIEEEKTPKIKKKLKKSLREEVREELKAELHDSVTRSLRQELQPRIVKELRTRLANELRAQVIAQLKDDLQDEVCAELGEALHDQVYEKLREELRPAVEADLREDLLREIDKPSTLEASEQAEAHATQDDEAASTTEYIDPALQAATNSAIDNTTPALPPPPTLSEEYPDYYQFPAAVSTSHKRRFSDTFDEEGWHARKRARSIEDLDTEHYSKTAGHTPRNPDEELANLPPFGTLAKYSDADIDADADADVDADDGPAHAYSNYSAYSPDAVSNAADEQSSQWYTAQAETALRVARELVNTGDDEQEMYYDDEVSYYDDEGDGEGGFEGDGEEGDYDEDEDSEGEEDEDGSLDARAGYSQSDPITIDD